MRYITTQWEIGVKNRYAEDGAIGHHWLKWMVGPILAQKYGLQYVYKSFLEYENSPSWDKFLGFGNCVPSKLNTKGVPFYNIKNIEQDIFDVYLPKLAWDCGWDDPVFKRMIGNDYKFEVFFKIAPGQAMAFDWSYYLNNDLREKYDFARQKDPIVSDLDPNIINVVTHIRHGDVNINDQPERWITNEQYEFIFNQINKFINNCVIHICSEGKIADFGNLSKIKNVVFHLEESPFKALNRMINADIFIPAKSAFSTLVCYLNRKCKMCIPFSVYWFNFPDLPELIPVNNNFEFDNKKLIKFLDNKK